MAVIKVENLCKKYIIGHQGGERYTALRDVIANKVKSVFKVPGMIKNGVCPAKDSTEEFWALKDLNFEINQGDRVGIIGRNGAGKSTLLKVLSRITEPTTGKISIKGRVASLLEVGTGFHPELTGRENIFLNGAILGMSRSEVKKKFDEIVDFAEVEKFLDTPVKRFSSGMYVRLAFAVAAHLEPEILVVDEVLAVGDAEFQKKCLGKMEDVSKNEGRTVIFVSHNMAAIKNICTTSIVMNKGEIILYGNTGDAVEHYLSRSGVTKSTIWNGKHKYNDYVEIKSVELVTIPVKNGPFDINDNLILNIKFLVKKKVSGVAIEIFLKTLDGITVFSAYTDTRSFLEGDANANFTIPQKLLNNLNYSFTVGVSQNYAVWLVEIKDAITFELMNVISSLGWQGEIPGVVRPAITWNINRELK